MILHLFNDEKVVNRAISLFEEALPDNNIFVCRIEGAPKHVIKQKNLFYYDSRKEFDTDLLKSVDKVVVHMLVSWKINFINKYINKPYQLYWMIWGGDMYNGLIANLGYDIYYEPAYLGVKWRIESFILYCLFKSKFKIGNLHKTLDFISSVNYFKTSLAEYSIQKRYLGDYMKGTPLPSDFNMYYCLEDILGKGLMNSQVHGCSIQIGNSASISANHLYVYKYLSKLNIGERKIYAPLGYGGNKKYINHVVKEGKKQWGESFCPILNFLDLSDYNKLMLSSDIYLFGNWRQEAAGNVLVALYLGAKVFLSKKSPLLETYSKIGIKLYCLEEIEQCDIDTALDKETQEKNRNLVSRMLDKKRIVEGIKAIWG